MIINGNPADSITLENRSLQFGDGVFETCKVVNGEIILWDYHYRRLCNGVKHLGINLNTHALQQEINALLMHFTDGVLKIIISRGNSKRGYGYNDLEATRILFTYPLPTSTDIQHITFCRLGYGLNAHLAGIKHQNRLEQILALGSNANTECIMLDSRDYVISTTSGNLFIISDTSLITPDLQCSGIQGTRREYIIDSYKVVVKNISIKEVLAAAEVFTCNSVYGIRSILSINATEYATNQTNTIKQSLQL